MLERLHSEGIVHGNLKPSKILTALDHQQSDTLYLNGLDKAEIINNDVDAQHVEKRIRLRIKLQHGKFTSLAAHFGYRKYLGDISDLFLNGN